MMDTGNYVFLPEQAFDMETAGFLMKCAEEGALEELGYIEPIHNRLAYILKNISNITTEHTDDMLLEIAAKYIPPEKHPDIYAAMIDIVISQCEPFVKHDLQKKNVAFQEWDDYISVLKVLAVSRMQQYDASKGKPVTFLKPYILNDFYKESNQDKSKHYTEIIRFVTSAKNQLMAEGVSHPDENTIAEKINSMQSYMTVSSKQVRFALSNLVCAVDFDEATVEADDSANPENRYMEEAEKELFMNGMENSHWAVRALYKVYLDYYFSENPKPLEQADGTENEPVDTEESESVNGCGNTESSGNEQSSLAEGRYMKKLPMDYLKKAMKEKTGVSFSEESINNLYNSMKDELAAKGLAGDYRFNHGSPHRIRVVDMNNLFTTQFDEVDDGYESVEGSGVKIYDLTDEITIYK